MPLPDYAVVVGIQAYPNFGPGGAPAALQAPVRNARAVRDWLVEKGGVAEANIALILDEAPLGGADPEPSKAKIENALNVLARKAQAQKEQGLGELVGRRLYLYMSGHGWSPGVQQSCLFAANARLDETHNVHATGWLRWFQDAAYFREFVLWMDCCMDRFSTFPPGSIERPAVPGRSVPGPSFVSFAAQRPLKAAEVINPVSGQPDGAFTWALLDGLNGAAVDLNGRVTGRSLADWLRQSVLARLPEAARRDYDIAKEPEIASESSELIFARELAPRRFKVKLTAADMPRTGEMVIWTGSPLREETRLPLKGRALALDLPPGLYHAEHSGSGLSASFEVVCDSEVVLVAGKPPLRPPPRDALFTLNYDPPDPTVEITIVDHRFAAVERGIGQLRTRLPAGLFKLRTRSGRNIEDWVLLLDRDMGALADDIAPPARATVVPIQGTLASHEYQAGALAEFAVRSRAAPRPRGLAASLSLMVRTFGETAPASGEAWSQVSIVDRFGKEVLSAERDVQRDRGRDPFALTSATVPPGAYELRLVLDATEQSPVSSSRVVRQSLILPRNWNLEVHVLRRFGETGLDGRPRIALHMARQGETPNEHERRLVEAARTALADERPILGRELEQLLVRKFSNPIAGIFGAHLLILGEDSGQLFDPGLLNTVVRNLRSLVGSDHPDVEAVSLRCTDASLRTERTRMAHAPMLERSWRLLVESSYIQPRLLSDTLVARLLAPSALPPFLVWPEDVRTRRLALRQLHEAVWAPRHQTEAPPRAPFRALSNVSRSSEGSRGGTSKLSRKNRRDRQLARERASDFNLPSNTFRRLLDREEPGG